MTTARTIFDEVPEHFHEVLFPLLEAIHQNLNEDTEKAYDGIENIRLKLGEATPAMLKALSETIFAWETQPTPLSWRQSLLLGGIYKDGFGEFLRPDHVKAHKYFSLGEALGSTTAIHLLGHLYSNAADSKIVLANPDESKAVEIFFRAAEKGDKKAQGHVIEIFKLHPKNEKICFYASLSLFGSKVITQTEAAQLKMEFNYLAAHDSQKFDALSDEIVYERIEPLLEDKKTKEQVLKIKWEKLLAFYLALGDFFVPDLTKLILPYLCLQSENYTAHAVKQKWEAGINYWKPANSAFK